MKKAVIEFLRESNAIEGVYDDASLEQAKVAWEYLMSQDKMTPSVVLKTHKLLMLNQKGLMPDEKGYFRRRSVWIGGHEAMHYAKIEGEMKVWCGVMNLFPNRPRLTADMKEQRSRRLHVEYEKVHPFVDGNGRTGRMFMNWWRLRNRLPLLIIHEGEEQMAYYTWFN